MVGILLAIQIGNNEIQSDKAKPRVIVGRLPAVAGGRPAAPEMAQAGKATGPDLRDSRVAEAGLGKPDYRGLMKW